MQNLAIGAAERFFAPIPDVSQFEVPARASTCLDLTGSVYDRQQPEDRLPSCHFEHPLNHASIVIGQSVEPAAQLNKLSRRSATRWSANDRNCIGNRGI
jgi:hypothetical protein